MDNKQIPHGRDLSAEQVARILDEWVNANGQTGYNAFAAEVTDRVHRTLQQRIMGLFVAAIEAWAALPEGRYDLRNEATVKLARKLLQTTDKYDRFLPLI